MRPTRRCWTRWLDEYRASADGGRVRRSTCRKPVAFPGCVALGQRSAISCIHEVVPATRIKIVNSDPRRGRPASVRSSRRTRRVAWRAAEDLCTIFVSGNVMSRGLTLEGLTTTLFLRTSDDPYGGHPDADAAVVRLSRRVPRALPRVPARHASSTSSAPITMRDEALRRTVLRRYERAGSTRLRRRACSRDVTSRRPASSSNVSNVPLCPGATPFVRLDEQRRRCRSERRSVIARDVRLRAVAGPGRQRGLRGRILLRAVFRSIEAADLIDELRYQRTPSHSQTGWEGARWKDLEPKVGIDA